MEVDHKAPNHLVHPEARRHPQKPPEERPVCITVRALTPPPHLKDASPSQQLFTNSEFQTTLTTLSGSHVRIPVGVVNFPRVSARGLTAHAYV